MHLPASARPAPRRLPGVVLLCLLCALALVLAQASRAMAAVPTDLAPSLLSICSASGDADGGGGAAHAGGHGDCCLGHTPGPALPSGLAAWQLPPLRLALVPALWLTAPRPLAVWAPWQSRAPPRA